MRCSVLDHRHSTASPRTAARIIAIALLTVGLVSPFQALARSPAQGTAAALADASPGVPTAEGGGSDGTSPVPATKKYARWLRNLGLDPALVTFLPGTLSTAEVVGPYTIAVHHDFPDGSSVDLRYRLVQSVGMSVADRPEFTSDPENGAFQMRYEIDASTIPTELLPQGLDELPAVLLTATKARASAQLLALAPVGPVRGVLTAEQQPTAGIIVDNLRDEAIGQVIDQATDPGLVGSNFQGNVIKVVQAGQALKEAKADVRMYGDALDNLERLRDCAEDPTNPLTEQAYQEDPGAQQQVVDELDDAISDTEADAVVTVIMTLAGPGASLVKGAPGLGFIVGAAKDWSKQTLKSVLDDRVKQADNQVVPCRLNFSVSGAAPTVSLSGTICDIERPFKVQVAGDFVGTIAFTPHAPTFGRWSFKGKETNAGFGMTGSGEYSIKLSDDHSSGSLDFKFTTTVHRPVGGNGAGGGKVSLQLMKIPPCLPGGA